MTKVVGNRQFDELFAHKDPHHATVLLLLLLF
jgi:hypothetical protein